MNVRYDVAKKLAYFVEYLWIYWLIFAIFSPHESALRADDRSVAYIHLSRDVAMQKFGWFGGLGVTQGHRKHCYLIERI